MRRLHTGRLAERVGRWVEDFGIGENYATGLATSEKNGSVVEKNGGMQDPSNDQIAGSGKGIAHHWYADSFLISMGRTEEAVAEMRKAQELDPLSLIINTDVGKELIFAHRYPEVVEQLKRALDLDPHFSIARYWLWFAYTETGRYAECVQGTFPGCTGRAD